MRCVNIKPWQAIPHPSDEEAKRLVEKAERIPFSTYLYGIVALLSVIGIFGLMVLVATWGRMPFPTNSTSIEVAVSILVAVVVLIGTISAFRGMVRHSRRLQISCLYQLKAQGRVVLLDDASHYERMVDAMREAKLSENDWRHYPITLSDFQLLQQFSADRGVGGSAHDKIAHELASRVWKYRACQTA